MWAPDSWRQKSALQQPEYADPAEVERVLADLRALPPLVTSWEILRLREQLAEAAEGRQFVLQAGDCAERFVDCTPVRITNTLKVLLQMSLVLVIGARRPVIRIGRFAGQYAKPRSANHGNPRRSEPALLSRRQHQPARVHAPRRARPDPQLLLRGYERASMTLNFVRALVKGGFADLHHPEYFDLDWVKDSPLAHEYHRMVQTIKDSLQFVENVLGVRAGDTDKIDFFTCHEALHLGYESAQTRRVPRRPGLLQPAHAFPVGGAAHQRSGRRAHGVPARDREPDGDQGGRGLHARAGGALAGDPGSGAAARTAHLYPPLRRAEDCRCPAPADRARARGGRQAGVDLRPDARQHAHAWPAGSRRATSRTSIPRWSSPSTFTRDGPAAGRRTHRTHRRECHGVPGRLAAVRARPTWRARTRAKSIRA